MELIIRKDQAKKMMGGVAFQMKARVVLNKEEQMLVDRYKAHKWVLHQRDKVSHADKAHSTAGAVAGIFMDKAFNNITVYNLMSGVSFSCKDINDILDHEMAIKQVGENLYLYLEVMKNFGGEEVIRYPEALQEEK